MLVFVSDFLLNLHVFLKIVNSNIYYMRKRILLILPVLSLFLFSCSREFLIEKAEQDGLVKRDFVVSCGEITKAYLGDDLKAVWEVGDSISVYDPIAKVGRLFKVSEIVDGRAKITGTISEGDFPFSGVYPFKAVKSWTSQTEYVPEYPKTQPVRSGHNISRNALMSSALDADANGIISFTPDASLLKFKILRSDIASVILQLKASAGADPVEYRVTADDGVFPTGEYYALVAPGTYAGGLSATCRTPFDIDYRKSSSNTLTAVAGKTHNLKEISNGTKSIHYELIQTETYNGANSFVTYLKTYFGLGDEYDEYIEFALNLLGDKKNDVMNTYIFKYKSSDFDGNPVTLSGRLFIPQKAFSGTKLDGLLLYNHPTYLNNNECPSKIVPAEGALAWFSLATFLPDYYGFGSSVKQPQAYADCQKNSQGIIDGMKAMKQMLSDMGATYGSKCMNIGYSQGGMMAISNLKYVANNPGEGISFTKTFAGAGVYDFNICYNQYTSGSWPNATVYFADVLANLLECHNMSSHSANVFQEPLLSNYRTWILSKNYYHSYILGRIGNDLSKVVTPDVMNHTGATVESIVKIMDDNSLLKGWSLPSDSKVYIYHSKDDDVVPYANFTAIKNFLGTDSLFSTKKRFYKDGNDGNHEDCVVTFALWAATYFVLS